VEECDDEWEEIIDPVTDEYAYVNTRTKEARRSLAQFNTRTSSKAKSPFSLSLGENEEGSSYVVEGNDGKQEAGKIHGRELVCS
jgi:hypothetical protein